MPYSITRNGGYVLLGYGEDESRNSYPAYFVIQHNEAGKYELVDYDSLYSLNTKKIDAPSNSGRGYKASTPISKISIDELLDIVNAEYSDILSDDVLQHFGTTRKDTKLGRSVKYQRREQPEDYEEENERLRYTMD